ncbi:MAG: hypothetical protein K0Q74_119 [Gammaproteobacteria bacterium]|jgi:hypothetical protein|nr:hypothetical protein [Gammaproteobacteria bacterium]
MSDEKHESPLSNLPLPLLNLILSQYLDIGSSIATSQTSHIFHNTFKELMKYYDADFKALISPYKMLTTLGPNAYTLMRVWLEIKERPDVLRGQGQGQEEKSDFYDKLPDIGNKVLHCSLLALAQNSAERRRRGIRYELQDTRDAYDFHKENLRIIQQTILREIFEGVDNAIPRTKIPQIQALKEIHPYYFKKLIPYFNNIQWRKFLRQFAEGLNENELHFINDLLSEEKITRSNSRNSDRIASLLDVFLEAMVDFPVLGDALLSGLTESNFILIFTNNGELELEELLEIINSDEVNDTFRTLFFARLSTISSTAFAPEEKFEGYEGLTNYNLATVGSNFRVLGARPQSAGSKKAAATTAEADSFDHDVAENPSQASSRPPSPSPFG